ncbi:MAG: cytochrome c [Blastocatellia bacterium]|nr:cytochrome c [Blastocatellia bacterium]
MTKKNHLRIALLVVSLLLGLRALHSVSAHDGHKQRNAPASAKKLKNPVKAEEETIAAGRALFNKNCASCHGEDGKSKTDVAAALKKKPTDLTAKAMSGITDGEIYWVVTNGIKKSGMPAYKLKAKEQERWQMTLYVKHLMGEHTDDMQAQDHSAHHAGVNQRGDKVMGFSHEKTGHHFRLKPDGGWIEVEVKDPKDTASRDQIRTHLKHIAQKFSAGDFTAPMLIHDKTPAGVPTMKQLKTDIQYQFEEMQRGARVRIVTSNAKAIAAIHEFLRFQISDHRTSDSGEVEKTN